MSKTPPTPEKFQQLLADNRRLTRENKRLKSENTALRRLTTSKRFRAAEKLATTYNQLLPLDTRRRKVVSSIGKKYLRRRQKKQQNALLPKIKRIQELIGDHDKIIVIDSISYDTQLQQRPHHIANEFAKLGYFVIYYEPTNYIQEFRKINDHLITINSHRFLEGLTAKQKFFLLPNTMATAWNELMEIKSWGYQIIYDYIDEFHEDISGDLALQLEIWERLDEVEPVACIVTAEKLRKNLVKEFGNLCPVIKAANGVNPEHFNYRKQDKTVPKDLRDILALKRPVIGFYGALAPWIDFKLINETAARHQKDWEFVLIGMDYNNSIGALKPAPNVHYLGAKDYRDLAGYAKHFDCAILPFRTGGIARATSPVKLFEYMAAGLPTVCTRDLYECRGYDYVYMAQDAKDFDEKLAVAIKDHKDPAKRRRLLAQAEANTWANRVATIADTIERLA